MLNKDQYYTGTVVEILDPVLYEISVDIPGMALAVKAFPMRGEIDEPRIGDFVLLRSLDPVFNSYYLYQKIKENDYIGFRSNGKMVDITPDYIKIAIFDPTVEYNDKTNYRPDEEGNGMVTDWIKLDKDGNLDINLRANSKINIITDSGITIGGNSDIKVTGNSTIGVDGDSSISVGGNSDISVGGNSNVKVSGSTKLTSPDVTITGGKLTVSGTVSPSNGPFCALPACAFTGAPHTGNIVVGT